MENRGGARKGAGRQKGKPNKDKRELMDMLEEKFPGYHPIIALAELAHTTTMLGKDGVETDKPDKNMQYQCHREIAKYITPQLKSVDHKIELEADIIIDIPTEED